jgi:hypothetical protein
MSKIILVVFLVGAMKTVGVGQTPSNQALQGDWIQAASQFDVRVGRQYSDIFDIKYVRMSFTDSQVTIAYNSVELKHLSFQYIIVGDTLAYGSNRFKLEFQGTNQITLTNAQDATPLYLMKVLPEAAITNPKEDTIYPTSLLVGPRFRGSLARLFLNAGLIDYPAIKRDRIISAEFTLMKNGSIHDASVESNHAAWRNRLFRKALQRSEGSWIVPEVSGHPISTRVKFDVVRLGGKSIRKHQLAERHFHRALPYIKTDPDLAIKKLTMSILLEPENAKYYYYRAICFYYTLDADRMCQDIAIARERCPFLPTEFIDFKERLQVKCLQTP